MDASSRETLLEQLRSFLETCDTSTDQIGDATGNASWDATGSDEPEAPDLFTLLAELAALKNEVRVESRQVKAALDQFGALFDTVRESSRRLQDELGRERERATAERRESERDLLLDLLDLRDRLSAGSEQAARYTPGWLARRGGAGEFIGGLAEGMAMNLRRLDEMLLRRGVRPLEALGQPFDPHTMRAVAITRDPAIASGLVAEVTRAGFLRDGQPLRAAEVIVNKGSTERE